MKVTKLEIDAEVQAKVQAAADRGESTAALAQMMADMKLNKVEAIRLMAISKKMPLSEAKETVHYSPAWAFRREADEAFHESLYEALDQMIQEEEVVEAQTAA
jgi:ribosomal protein L7/L12